MMAAPAGFEERHGRQCAIRNGSGCSCSPTYQANVYDQRTGWRMRKTFSTKTAATRWRRDAIVALRAGTLQEAKPKTTVREVCEAWLEDARAGVVRARSGDPFKPATIRSYDQSFRIRVYPTLGSLPVSGSGSLSGLSCALASPTADRSAPTGCRRAPTRRGLPRR